jgi:putative peptidoglycan lipid II flippase
LAISVAALLNAWLLFRGLRRDAVLELRPGWLAYLARIVVANAAMCVILFMLAKPLGWWLDASLSGRVVELAVNICAGAAVYFAALFLTGLRPSHLGLRPH